MIFPVYSILWSISILLIMTLNIILEVRATKADSTRRFVFLYTYYIDSSIIISCALFNMRRGLILNIIVMGDCIINK